MQAKGVALRRLPPLSQATQAISSWPDPNHPRDDIAVRVRWPVSVKEDPMQVTDNDIDPWLTTGGDRIDAGRGDGVSRLPRRHQPPKLRGPSHPGLTQVMFVLMFLQDNHSEFTIEMIAKKL